jgi:class 3 adenylate cyclase
MKSNPIDYDLEKSVARIDEILKAEDSSFEEKDSIPSRDTLTFNNGFYVNCSAIFVDIRKSSELTDFHKNRVLAKLYRAYISEVVAVINGNKKCVEINVVGDCVSGVFDIIEKTDIDTVFTTACTISSLIKILNCRLTKFKIRTITVGIGVSWGRALMTKAGYDGSGINEVIWMGNVVNETSKLASYGNRESYDQEMMISKVFHFNLSEENKKWFTWNQIRECYQANVGIKYMNDWHTQNCT